MRTLKNLLCTALLPVGHTMYIWGGGWNEADTGAGVEAVSCGLSPRWRSFASRQTAAYDWHTTRYQIHDGLDCSGYIGWLLYNTLVHQGGGAGYVMPAGQMAQAFASRGWGTFTPAAAVTCRRPGDILSTGGHVFLSLGDCVDGSALLVHASPPGVQVSGTPTPAGDPDSDSIRLASYYMKHCHPTWHSRFPESARPLSYLTTYDRFSWRLRSGVLRDPDNLAECCAPAVLSALCGRIV